jgi:hypothetical protein
MKPVNRVSLTLVSDETMSADDVRKAITFRADGNDWLLEPPQHLSRDFREALAKLLLSMTDGREDDVTVPALQSWSSVFFAKGKDANKPALDIRITQPRHPTSES